MLLLVSAGVLFANPVVYYVSTDGDNTFSGTLPQRNPEGTDGPLATLRGARDKIRILKFNQWGGTMQASIEVQVRGGIYYESESLQLFHYDSGDSNYSITYKAYPGESPIFSGGKVITGFLKPVGENYYIANIPEAANRQWKFRQLWVDGKRYTFAKSPNKGYYYVAGIPPKPPGLDDYWENYWQCHYFNFHEEDLKNWAGISQDDINIRVYSLWEVQTIVLTSVDIGNKKAFSETHCLWGYNPQETNSAGGKAKRYIVEGAPDSMDAAGEWLLDRATGDLKIIPFAGEDISAMTVVAPVMEKALELVGNPDNSQYVKYVNFSGLTFTQYAAPELLSQADGGGGYRSNQGATNHSSYVQLDGAQNIRIEQCEFSRHGSHGIQLGRGCSDVTIEQCHLFDTGAGGIYIGERIHSESSGNPLYDPGVDGDGDSYADGETHHNTVHNNYIHHGGQVVQSGMGILIGQAHHNTITNNRISHFAQSGMQLGWNWDTAATWHHDNLVEFNHISDIGLNISSDLAGIYTVGDNQNTMIRNNIIHDVYTWMQYSGKGLYPDEQTHGVTFEKNLIYNIGTYGFGVNYCRDITVTNNIFAMNSGKAPFMFGHRANADINRNIFYYQHGNVYSDNYWKMQGAWFQSCDNNLYWRTGGKEVMFQKWSPDGSTQVFDRLTFEQWKTETGLDGNSVVADPLFVDPENCDFRLKSRAESSKIGFEEIDYDAIGLTGDPSWTNLPGQFEENEFYVNFIEPWLGHDSVHQPFSDNGLNYSFEYTMPLDVPKDCEISDVDEAAGAFVQVNDDMAFQGSQSMAVHSATGYQPSVEFRTYDPIIYSGMVRFTSWFYKEAGAGIAVNFYSDNGGLDNRFANLDIYPAGQNSTAFGYATVDIPDETWFRVDFTFGVGDQAGSGYEIRIETNDTVLYQGEINNPFNPPHNLRRFVIKSFIENKVIYVDNLGVKGFDDTAFDFNEDKVLNLQDFGLMFLEDNRLYQQDITYYDSQTPLYLNDGDYIYFIRRWLGQDTSGIKASWPFAQVSGTVLSSDLPGGLTAVLTGTESWTGDSFVFDGASWFAAYRTDPAFTMRFNSDFNVSCDIKTTQSSAGTIWSWLEDSWEPGCKQFSVLYSGILRFDCGWVGTVDGSQVINDGNWHHVEVDYDALENTITITVDETEDVSSPLPNDLTLKPDDFDFFIGCQQDLGGGIRNNYFEGEIKNMVVKTE